MNRSGSTSCVAPPGARGVGTGSAHSGPLDREGGLNVTVDPDILSNNPYSESNWISTQQLPSMPIAQSSTGNLMPSPLVEAAHANVAEERNVTDTADDKVYRETAANADIHDAVSTNTGYLTSTQGGTYTSGQGATTYTSGGNYFTSAQGGNYSSSGQGGTYAQSAQGGPYTATVQETSYSSSGLGGTYAQSAQGGAYNTTTGQLTNYTSSGQGGTYAQSAQGGAYNTTTVQGTNYSSSSTAQGGTYASSAQGGTLVSSYPSQSVAQSSSQGLTSVANTQGVSFASGGLKPSFTQEWQSTTHQVATLEVSPLPSSTNVVTTTTSSTIPPLGAGGVLSRGEGTLYREETQHSGRRDTDTLYTTGDVRNYSGVGENRLTDTNYGQSFATLRDNAFLSSGWATNAVDSRVTSRMSSTVMSTVTYPPHPDQMVICWPPRVVQITQGAYVTNADVERWKGSTANTQGYNVQIVETDVTVEKTVEKPVPVKVEKIREVKVPVVEWTEKIVEEPVTEWREVQKFVDQEVWSVVKKPVKQVMDKIVEKIVEVKKVVPKIKEVVHEVPMPVERPVPVPTPYSLTTLNARDIKKPTVVAQILKSTLRTTEEEAEVNLKEFVPELVPVVIQIPKPVSIQVWLGGIVSTVHRQTTVTAAHWNSLVKIANPSIKYPEILPYMQDIITGFIPFLPASERIEWVEPISDEWRQTGWSHVIVPDGYVIRSLEVVIAEFNEARQAEYREAKLKLAQQTTTTTTTTIQTTSADLYGPSLIHGVSDYSHLQGSTSGLLAGSTTGPTLNSSTTGFNYSFAAGTRGNLHNPGSLQSSLSSLPTSLTKTTITQQQQQSSISGRSLGKLAGATSKPSILLSDLPVTRDPNSSARDPNNLPGTFVSGDL